MPRAVCLLFFSVDRPFEEKHLIAQNAYCSRDIYLQFMKYLRSVILPSIIQINARRRVSLVKINARFFPLREYDLAH